MKRRLQARDAKTQQPVRAIDSPHLTPNEAVAYLRLGSLGALYYAVNELGLPYGRIGRKFRFRKDHLDRWLEVRGVDSASLSRSQRTA